MNICLRCLCSQRRNERLERLASDLKSECEKHQHSADSYRNHYIRTKTSGGPGTAQQSNAPPPLQARPTIASLGDVTPSCMCRCICSSVITSSPRCHELHHLILSCFLHNFSPRERVGLASRVAAPAPRCQLIHRPRRPDAARTPPKDSTMPAWASSTRQSLRKLSSIASHRLL